MSGGKGQKMIVHVLPKRSTSMWTVDWDKVEPTADWEEVGQIQQDAWYAIAAPGTKFEGHTEQLIQPKFNFVYNKDKNRKGKIIVVESTLTPCDSCTASKVYDSMCDGFDKCIYLYRYVYVDKSGKANVDFATEIKKWKFYDCGSGDSSAHDSYGDYGYYDKYDPNSQSSYSYPAGTIDYEQQMISETAL